MTYRYLGQMLDPAGKRLVYVTKGDRDIQVGAGMQLEDGYVVESITAGAVRVVHAATQTRIDIPIPASKESTQ